MAGADDHVAARVGKGSRRCRPRRLERLWRAGQERDVAKRTCVDPWGVATPQLGEYYLDAIKHHDVVPWRDAQDAEPSTVNSRLRVLKTLLADTTVAFDPDRDPSIRVPSVREHKLRDDENANCLTPDPLRALLGAMSRTAPRWYPLLALLAFTGMRVGEATALQWHDIDEESAFIHVRRSIDRGQLDTT